MRTGWIILAVAAVVVLGLVSGVTSLLFAPILGGVAVIVMVVWLVKRWARSEPN